MRELHCGIRHGPAQCAQLTLAPDVVRGSAKQRRSRVHRNSTRHHHEGGLYRMRSRIFATSRTDAFAARFGGGIDIYITARLAFQTVVSYLLPTGDLDGSGCASLVVGAQFGF
jgi:hypothetical protein